MQLLFIALLFNYFTTFVTKSELATNAINNQHSSAFPVLLLNKHQICKYIYHLLPPTDSIIKTRQTILQARTLKLSSIIEPHHVNGILIPVT